MLLDPCRPSAFVSLLCFCSIIIGIIASLSVSVQASGRRKGTSDFFARLELKDFSDDTIVENKFGVPTVKYASAFPSKRLPGKDGRACWLGGETQRRGTEPSASPERIQMPDRRLVASC